MFLIAGNVFIDQSNCFHTCSPCCCRNESLVRSNMSTPVAEEASRTCNNAIKKYLEEKGAIPGIFKKECFFNSKNK